jgi:hypothetical protein
VGLPALLVAAGVAWLCGGSGGPELAAGTFPFRIDVDAAPGALAAAAAARASCLLVRGERDGRVHGVALHQRFEPALLLAAGGAGASAAELVEEARALQNMARALAPALALAYLSVEPTLAALRKGEPSPEPGRAVQAGLVRRLADEVALDAFHWQLLGQGHRARLSAPPPGAIPLPGDRMELTVGTFADWLGPSPALPTLRADARTALAPLLLPTRAATAMVQARAIVGSFRLGPTPQASVRRR